MVTCSETPCVQYVLEQITDAAREYVDYEGLVAVAHVATQANVSDKPRVDTTQHPIGLVVRTAP